MRFTVIIVLLFIELLAFNQTTVIKFKETKGYFEEYRVLENQQKVKHGDYLKYSYSIGDHILIDRTGKYHNGLKEGEWRYYEGNRIIKVETYKAGLLHGDYYEFYIEELPGISNATSAYWPNPKFGNPKTIKYLNKYDQEDSLDVIIYEKQIVRIEGYYSGGLKRGAWKYRLPNGESYFEYNFTDNTLIIDIRNGISNMEIYNVKDIDVPIYLGGGLIDLGEEIFEETVYDYGLPFKFSENDSLSFEFKLRINKEGKLKKIRINKDPDNFYDDFQIVKPIKLSENWIPAKSDGEFYDCRLIFDFKVRKEGVNTYHFGIEHPRVEINKKGVYTPKQL